MPEGPAQQHDLPGVVEVVLGEPDELREGRIRRIRDERVVEVRGRKRRDRLAQSPVEREERFDFRRQASSVGSDGVGQSSSGDNCLPSPSRRRSTS